MSASTLTPVRLTAVPDLEHEDSEHLALQTLASVRSRMGLVTWFSGDDDDDPSPLAA